MDTATKEENRQQLPAWARPQLVIGVWFVIYLATAFLIGNAMLAANLLATLLVLYIAIVLLLNVRFLVGKRRATHTKFPKYFVVVALLGVFALSTARQSIGADIASGAYSADKIAEYCGQLLVPIGLLIYVSVMTIGIYAKNLKGSKKAL